MNLVTSYWLWTIKNILVSVIRKKIDGVNHTKYDDTSDLGLKEGWALFERSAPTRIQKSGMEYLIDLFKAS